MSEVEIETIIVSKEEFAIRQHMTSAYTSMWKLSDFLLDIAAEINDPNIANQIHSLHAEVTPSRSREIIETVEANRIITKAIELWTTDKNSSI
jgi:hypothetical protein